MKASLSLVSLLFNVYCLCELLFSREIVRSVQGQRGLLVLEIFKLLVATASAILHL